MRGWLPVGWTEARRAFFMRWQAPIRRTAVFACRLYRRVFLRRVTFIGITGSCGKTTTKNLVAAMLATRGRVSSNPATRNHFGAVVRLVLGTRPWHRFCVGEIAAMREGDVPQLSAFFLPDVAVVTALGTDHYRSFRGPAGAAREKGALLEALPADGVAVLNRDDPHVWEMRQRTSARIVSFGAHPEAEIRLLGCDGGWPDGYTMSAATPEGEVRIAMKLWGRHQAMNLLAALGAAQALGIRAGEVADALAAVEPEPGRLSVVRAPGGITLLRDDGKASPLSLGPMMDVVREARAARKVLVFGTLSDYPGDSSRAYRRLAEEALRTADEVLFVGPNAERVRKVCMEDGRAARRIATVREAAEYLEATGRAGDLVILKASISDHLERLALRHEREVTCWRERCGVRQACDACPYVNRPDARLPARGR